MAEHATRVATGRLRDGAALPGARCALAELHDTLQRTLPWTLADDAPPNAQERESLLTMSHEKRTTRPSPSERLRVIEAAARLLQSGNLLHRIAEDERLDGRRITLDGRHVPVKPAPSTTGAS